MSEGSESPSSIAVPRERRPRRVRRGMDGAAVPRLRSPSDGVMSPITQAFAGHRMFRSFTDEETAGGNDGAGGPALPIILGSSSPWRQEVMRELGYEFRIEKPDIDEKAVRHPDPLQLPVAVARAKAVALQERVTEPAILITGDQVVLAPPVAPSDDGAAPRADADDVTAGLEVREKPESAEEAEAFIRSYSGRFVRTVAAVVVTNTRTGAQEFGVDVATVHFDAIPDDAIAEALAPSEDGDPSPVMITCGAVCVEHPALAPFVTHIDGGQDSVFGLPKQLLATLMDRVGAPPPATPPALSHAGAAAVAVASHGSR